MQCTVARSSSVQRLPMSQDTKPVLLERLRDVAPAVRKAAVARLCSVPPSLLRCAGAARSGRECGAAWQLLRCAGRQHVQLHALGAW